MNTIRLPGIEIDSCRREERESVVMVLGGRAPSPGFLARLASLGEVWAVDRGVDICRGAGVVPSLLIGDRDSGSVPGRRWAASLGVPERRYERDKDLTDFQLALQIFVRERCAGGTNIILTGAFGGRFDHLWSAVVSFVGMTRSGVPFCVADDSEGMIFLTGGERRLLTFERRPEAVSLISFSPRCAGVGLSGTRWPLDGAELEYGFPYAVSNRVGESRRVAVSCREGTLGFYWTWCAAF